ncbi:MULTISPECIES: hypothetical protein [Blastococcus]|uniref:Uncharacterized protein n=2 Tax=Blastococcus TaxID=38501 RepID=A0A1I2KIA6_9ACTN|nr:MULTISPECIES: hypothetical protein [unclassified Blastococcus]WRL65520.1 hypothetical protein U6N30_07950 [Blastococcus sp. BMG 8361]SFF66684.1 hypothetical protein SAMN05216574_1222 [Blastococcus sp. DSM 46838]
MKLESLLPQWSLVEKEKAFDSEAWEQAVRSVHIECLAAGVPRKLTDQFVRAARGWSTVYRIKGADLLVGEWEALDDWSKGHSALLYDYLWHPRRTRLTYKRRLRALETQFDQFNEEAKQRQAARRAERAAETA